jgi:hypothetical protein
MAIIRIIHCFSVRSVIHELFDVLRFKEGFVKFVIPLTSINIFKIIKIQVNYVSIFVKQDFIHRYLKRLSIILVHVLLALYFYHLFHSGNYL